MVTARSRVEGAATAAERPVRKAVSSGRANPLPHAGTISVFLLIVVVVTGVYITLFYEYGFAASYHAVAKLQAHPIQRVMRALHRYSSAALVVTTLVHAWRIFVAGRFTGGRRHRWVTGVTALVVVWLAGVTGYWLVWDVRAQAIGDAVAGVIDRFGAGAALAGTWMGSTAGSGSTLMVVVWFAHLGLTAVIGWAVWRHVRRSRLPWLPPRHWMVLMGMGLLALAIVLPTTMLDAADSGRLTPRLPLDPFMLFLLPPLLSSAATWVALAAVVAIGVAVAVPWLLRATATPVVAIDAEACTGCELCVVDCPYLALSMADRSDAGLGAIAVVDADACVGCGICLGSCSFAAIDLPCHEAAGALEVEGRDVVVACARHLATGAQVGGDAVVLPVSCTGAFHVQAVGDLIRRGATGVQIVGCAPGDCAYGIGNELAHQRLAGDRAPHVARRYAHVATEDWVALGEVGSAHRQPGEHPDPDATHLPQRTRARAGAAVVVLASVALIGAATLAPYRGDADAAGVRVTVDHVPGNQLVGRPVAVPRSGSATTVRIEVDGEVRAQATLPTWQGSARGVVDASVQPGRSRVRVVLADGEARTVLQDGMVDLRAGRRLVVTARDVPPPPGVEQGKRVFNDPDKGDCKVCHSTSPGGDGVGPSLAGVADRAGTRVDGMTAEEYLRQSIVDPSAYAVEGYRGDQMLPIYADRLSPDEIQSLIDYLMTLHQDGN